MASVGINPCPAANCWRESFAMSTAQALEALPLVSIIVICHNQRDITRQCLSSVRAHSQQPYELLLLDNGSSDGVGQVLEDCARQSAERRVVVLRNESNRGYPAACNQTLVHARGR